MPWRQGERDLALAHLGQMQPGDLGLLDRGFAAYELWAQFIQQKRGFVCRCPKSSFSPINQLFADNQAGRSVEVTLRPEPKKRAAMRRAGLPETITVRLVTVRLPTGELEVLATNLLDETLYPTAAFAPLYHQRWGIETYYGLPAYPNDSTYPYSWCFWVVRPAHQHSIGSRRDLHCLLSQTIKQLAA